MFRGSDDKEFPVEKINISILRTDDKKDERFVHRPGYWKPINDRVYATDKSNAIEAEEASATPVYNLIRQKLRLTSEKTNLSSSSSSYDRNIEYKEEYPTDTNTSNASNTNNTSNTLNNSNNNDYKNSNYDSVHNQSANLNNSNNNNNNNNNNDNNNNKKNDFYANILEQFKTDLQRQKDEISLEPDKIYFPVKNPRSKLIMNTRCQLSSLQTHFMKAIQPIFDNTLEYQRNIHHEEKRIRHLHEQIPERRLEIEEISATKNVMKAYIDKLKIIAGVTDEHLQEKFHKNQNQHNSPEMSVKSTGLNTIGSQSSVPGLERDGSPSLFGSPLDRPSSPTHSVSHSVTHSVTTGVYTEDWELPSQTSNASYKSHVSSHTSIKSHGSAKSVPTEHTEESLPKEIEEALELDSSAMSKSVVSPNSALSGRSRGEYETDSPSIGGEKSSAHLIGGGDSYTISPPESLHGYTINSRDNNRQSPHSHLHSPSESSYSNSARSGRGGASIDYSYSISLPSCHNDSKSTGAISESIGQRSQRSKVSLSQQSQSQLNKSHDAESIVTGTSSHRANTATHKAQQEFSNRFKALIMAHESHHLDKNTAVPPYLTSPGASINSRQSTPGSRSKPRRAPPRPPTAVSASDSVSAAPSVTFSLPVSVPFHDRQRQDSPTPSSESSLIGTRVPNGSQPHGYYQQQQQQQQHPDLHYGTDDEDDEDEDGGQWEDEEHMATHVSPPRTHLFEQQQSTQQQVHVQHHSSPSGDVSIMSGPTSPSASIMLPTSSIRHERQHDQHKDNYSNSGYSYQQELEPDSGPQSPQHSLSYSKTRSPQMATFTIQHHQQLHQSHYGRYHDHCSPTETIASNSILRQSHEHIPTRIDDTASRASTIRSSHVPHMSHIDTNDNTNINVNSLDTQRVMEHVNVDDFDDMFRVVRSPSSNYSASPDTSTITQERNHGSQSNYNATAGDIGTDALQINDLVAEHSSVIDGKDDGLVEQFEFKMPPDYSPSIPHAPSTIPSDHPEHYDDPHVASAAPNHEKRLKASDMLTEEGDLDVTAPAFLPDGADPEWQLEQAKNQLDLMDKSFSEALSHAKEQLYGSHNAGINDTFNSHHSIHRIRTYSTSINDLKELYSPVRGRVNSESNKNEYENEEIFHDGNDNENNIRDETNAFLVERVRCGLSKRCLERLGLTRKCSNLRPNDLLNIITEIAERVHARTHPEILLQAGNNWRNTLRPKIFTRPKVTSETIKLVGEFFDQTLPKKECIALHKFIDAIDKSGVHHCRLLMRLLLQSGIKGNATQVLHVGKPLYLSADTKIDEHPDSVPVVTDADTALMMAEKPVSIGEMWGPKQRQKRIAREKAWNQSFASILTKNTKVKELKDKKEKEKANEWKRTSAGGWLISLQAFKARDRRELEQKMCISNGVIQPQSDVCRVFDAITLYHFTHKIPFENMKWKLHRLFEPHGEMDTFADIRKALEFVGLFGATLADARIVGIYLRNVAASSEQQGQGKDQQQITSLRDLDFNNNDSTEWNFVNTTTTNDNNNDNLVTLDPEADTGALAAIEAGGVNSNKYTSEKDQAVMKVDHLIAALRIRANISTPKAY